MNLIIFMMILILKLLKKFMINVYKDMILYLRLQNPVKLVHQICFIKYLINRQG